MTWAAALLFLLQSTDPGAEGLKALEARNYAAAAEAFARAVAAEPNDYFAHFHLALSYTMLRKDAEALAEYRKALELKPGLYEAELNAGILLLRDAKFADAVLFLQKAAAQKPKEYRPRYFLATGLLGAGDVAPAETEFRAALELDPRSADAENGLADALARQNKLADAAPHYRRAVELDATRRDVLLKLASLYEQNHQSEEAAAIYREFPDHPAAQERLGQILLQGGKFADAIPSLEAAHAKDPTTANRLALAEAYLFAKRHDKALPLLAQSVAAEPRNYDLRMMYARALRDQKQYPAAAREFLDGLKIKPDARQGWNDLAAMLYMIGDFRQAVGALDQARRLGENTPTNWYFRAISLDKLKELKPALESYEHFLSVAGGKYPDEEFKARQRARIIRLELSKK